MERLGTLVQDQHQQILAWNHVTTTITSVKWFLDVKTVAALGRKGSWDQSAQSTTARPKSGAVATRWKDWFSRNWNTWSWYGYMQHEAPLHTPLKSVVCWSSQEAAYTQLWNFTHHSSPALRVWKLQLVNKTFYVLNKLHQQFINESVTKTEACCCPSLHVIFCLASKRTIYTTHNRS